MHAAAGRGAINEFQLNSYQNGGASDDWPQIYWECVFDLSEDEALIIETDLPKVRKYWNIQVADAVWNQVEMVYRQSSLNGHQAKIDPDGKFRAVVSASDPGVANWLDTGGSLNGMLIGRWYACDTHPTPQLTRVKLSELSSRLPPDIPRVTADERKEALRIRRVGAQMRRRW
jgi:hypothetical protein